MSAEVAAVNALSAEQFAAAMRDCCTSSRWIEGMQRARPFQSSQHIQEEASRIWAGLDEADFLEAFRGHPKIGDLDSLAAKCAAEQAGSLEAPDIVLKALQRYNDEYEKRFGFIFIICAQGKPAAEMLGWLVARLANDRATEIRIAAAEQGKITALRLQKLVAARPASL